MESEFTTPEPSMAVSSTDTKASRTAYSRRRAASVAAVAGAALLWSTSFAATKAALQSLPPLTLGAARFTVAALLLGILSHRQRSARAPSPSERRWLYLGGLLGITLYFGMENVGVGLSTAADAALLVAGFPAITMVLEMLLFGVKISAVRFVGVGLALVGVLLIIEGASSGSASHRLLGDIILLLAGVAWAFYNFVTKRLGDGISPITIIYYQTKAGAAGFLVLSLAEYDSWSTGSAFSLLLVLYLAVFCSVAAFLLYAHGLRTMSPSSAVTLLNLVPVFGLITATAALGERVGWGQVAGGLIVISGVILSASFGGKRLPPGY